MSVTNTSNGRAGERARNPGAADVRMPAEAGASAAYQREVEDCLATAMDLHRLGHLAEAAQVYRALLGIDPGHFEATRLLGVLHDQLGQHDTACELLARATVIQPGSADAQYHYALALQNAGLPAQAAQVYAIAMSLAPKVPQIAENLAVALVDAGEEAAAVEVCKTALSLDPNSAIALSNLGTLYFNHGDTVRAQRHLARLLALRPALGQAHFKLAGVALRQSDFTRGWMLYERRFDDAEFLQASPPRQGAYPTWSGEDLSGRTILVTPEQGLGDEVMFASCLPDLIQCAEHVVIQCDERLRQLFARSFPAATVLGAQQPLSDLAISCCVSSGSLPRFFRPAHGSFVAKPYLRANPERVQYWREQIGATRASLQVGVSWAGGSSERQRAARSIPLREFLAVFEDSSATLVDLQYGDHQAELKDCEQAGVAIPRSLDSIDPLLNIDEFAAVIGALDLVVCVDNATAHLAAALGRPTWVALPAGAEWRWGEDSTQSNWYESARLFRRSPDAQLDWRPVVQSLRAALAQFNPATPKLCAPTEEPTPRTLPASQAGRTVVLLNDTKNWYHFGCTATSLALHDQLRQRFDQVVGIPISKTAALDAVPTTLAGFENTANADAFCAANTALIEALSRCDAVVINGEGSIHGRSIAACGLLYLAWLAATRFQKPTSIINHSAYPGDEEGENIYRAVYQKMEHVCVREPVSARVVTELGINVESTFDSLPVFIDRFYANRFAQKSDTAVLAGGVTWHEGAAPAMQTLIRQLRKAGLKIIVLLGARAYHAGEELRFAEAMALAHKDALTLQFANSEAEWLDTIAAARILISGRFHHSIAAAFLGTPLVASASNTAKMVGLMEACELPACIDVPNDWGSSNARKFADALSNRAAQALTFPAALTLRPEVRRRLLAQAYRNFPSLPDTQ